MGVLEQGDSVHINRGYVCLPGRHNWAAERIQAIRPVLPVANPMDMPEVIELAAVMLGSFKQQHHSLSELETET